MDEYLDKEKTEFLVKLSLILGSKDVSIVDFNISTFVGSEGNIKVEAILLDESLEE